VAGGFIGVDIFFVISGYLIAGLIVEELAHETFTFADFYVRRCKRILPALLLVLTACTIIGYFFELASEYIELGKYVASSAAFFSNFTLLLNSGYLAIITLT
jgi:peptidoglycan/LPS O-acetylase OafA/YrhL